MNNVNVSQHPVGSFELKQYIYMGLSVGLITVFVNLVIFSLFHYGLSYPLMVSDGSAGVLAPLSIYQVALSSFVPAVIATVILAILPKVTSKVIPAFLGVAGLFFVISFYPVVSFPVDHMSTRVVLGVMHVVAALSIVYGLSRHFKSDAA